ncbi:nucleotidyltransferase family protein [Luteibacter sp. PPL552]
MLPPLERIRTDLHRTTEALADAVAHDGATAMPEWDEGTWRIAAAVAVAHGVAPLLADRSSWPSRRWQAFLSAQRDHVASRQGRIATLLSRLDALARERGLPMMALKGSALHALGLYVAGERPMADIDLLVRPGDAEATAALLRTLDYEESFRQWKHGVFKPVGARPFASFGEHRDTPVNIELHTCIQERLPVRTVDVTASVWPRDATPGMCPYPSLGALMTHLLLHAAGNVCGRSLRLLHLHDIAQLARRMPEAEWSVLWHGKEAPWWAYSPLRRVERHWPGRVPRAVLDRLRRECPIGLRRAADRQTLVRVSCSDLWLQRLPGIEWVRSPTDMATLLMQRIRPSRESRQERADMVRTQVWLQGQAWVRQGHLRRVMTALTRPVPRMDTLYVVRGAWDA